MKLFLSNIILALLWALLSGEISQFSLITGFVLGYLVLGMMATQASEKSYFRKVRQTVEFALVFLRELAVSTWRVAYDILTPTHYMKPGVIAFPLEAKSDAEITLLANVITLTPGTLSLDVSEDRKTLYIHAMYIDDPDELRREIKEGLEKKLLEMMR
ncbi:MAG: Na+/H+ antiporter subunit E [Propionivibrio sp.]